MKIFKFLRTDSDIYVREQICDNTAVYRKIGEIKISRAPTVFAIATLAILLAIHLAS